MKINIHAKSSISNAQWNVIRKLESKQKPVQIGSNQKKCVSNEKTSAKRAKLEINLTLPNCFLLRDFFYEIPKINLDRKWV